MKALKTIGITIAVLLALVIVVALFLPAEVHVERSMVIKSAPANIYSQVNTLKNWEKWSPWHKIDPNMTLTYNGPADGVGASYSWKSGHDKVGNGTLTITEAKSDEFIGAKMEFDGMGVSNASYKFEKTAEGTKVTWAMDSKGEGLPWYMVIPSRYANLAMDGMVGPDFEKGLNNLREIAEKMPEASAVRVDPVEEVATPAMMVLTIKGETNGEGISAKLGEIYGKVMAYATKAGAKPTGAPFAVYHAWKDNHFVFDAGFPVDKKVASSGDIKYAEWKPGKAAKVNYYGTYMKMGMGHDAIHEWLKANNKKPSGDSWEVYVTDPTTVKDSSQIKSEIYYPL